MAPVTLSLALLVKGALVLARISGVILLLPMFGAMGVPRLARSLAALFLTVVVAPTVPETVLVETLPALIGAMISEFVVGLAMGSTVFLAFSSISIGAEIMATQMGLAAAQWFDPMFQNSQTALGRLCYWLAALVFLGTNQHLAVIQTVADSFDAVPPGALIDPGMLGIGWPHLVSATMAVGVRLAGPVILLVFLIQTFLAVLARLASAMNSFMSIGLILTMGAGYAILWVAMPGLLSAHQEFVQEVAGYLTPMAIHARGGPADGRE